MTSPQPRRIDRDRVRALLGRAGLDAVLLCAPLNVLWATGKTLVIERFSGKAQSAVLIPADPRAPIRLIASGFDVYFGGSDRGLDAELDLCLVSGGHADPAAGRPAAPVFPIVGEEGLSARELRRREFVSGVEAFHPDLTEATRRALAGLGPEARIGVDDGEAALLLAKSAPEVFPRPADDLALHLRAIKTPDEIALIEAASVATHAAVTAGAGRARAAGGLKAVRRDIFGGMIAQGVTPLFGNVDGMVDETLDEPLQDGRCLMLDFVGHLGFYQSDVGRTVFLGEPPAGALRAARAIETVWEALRPTLRPGLRFSELKDRAQAHLTALAPGLRSAFNPHLVGLQHWDQPRRAPDDGPLDLTLEAGMVLSLDCPLMGEGVGGSIHLEDLMLIKADGARALHPVGDSLIVA